MKNQELSTQLDAPKAKRIKKLAIDRHADKRDGGYCLGVDSENSGWLTPAGLLSPAIRRNLSNIATSDVGLILMMDLSRWTVCRAEIRAAACLNASAQRFWQVWREQLRSTSQHDSFSVTVVSYRQDATNSAVWQRSKLQALELEAGYIYISALKDEDLQLDGDDDGPAMGLPEFTRIKRLADVIPVDNGTGKATVAMTEKMLQSLGCPTWRTFKKFSDAQTDFETSLPCLAKKLRPNLFTLNPFTAVFWQRFVDFWP